VIDEHFNKTEKTKSRIDELLAENQEMELRLRVRKKFVNARFRFLCLVEVLVNHRCLRFAESNKVDLFDSANRKHL
jgi:hypothetical protein